MFAPGYLSKSTGITSWVTLAIHLKESMTPEGQNETIFQYLDIQDIAIMVSSTPTAPAKESSLRWLCSFLKFLFYIGVELINNVLVSGVQPSESVTYTHTHTHTYMFLGDCILFHWNPTACRCCYLGQGWVVPWCGLDPQYKPISVETWTWKSWRNEMGGAGWEGMWLEGPQGTRDVWRAWWERRNEEMAGAVCRWCSLEGKAERRLALAHPGPMMLGYANIMMLTAFKWRSRNTCSGFWINLGSE